MHFVINLLKNGKVVGSHDVDNRRHGERVIMRQVEELPDKGFVITAFTNRFIHFVNGGNEYVYELIGK